MNRVVGDHMGMLATVMNGLAMRDALHRADVNAKLMSAFQLNGICDTYNWSEAIKMLREKRVVIFSAVQVARSLLQILRHAYAVSKLKRISF